MSSYEGRARELIFNTVGAQALERMISMPGKQKQSLMGVWR